jgi:hypothetical protein
MLDASIIPARQDVAYAQAHWSRTRDRLASSAIDSRGPEEWAVAIVLVQQHAQHVTQAQKHFDQVRFTPHVPLEEIDLCSESGQRKDQAKRCRSHRAARMWWCGYCVQHAMADGAGGED